MKPLIILISSFVLCLLVIKYTKGSIETAFSGRIAMSVMLMFTAIGHFMFTKGMSLMLPESIPYRTELVLITGIIEILAAIGLLIPYCSKNVAWLLVAFFILVLPANIYASVKHLNYQKGTFDGNGLMYLWFRIPMQALLILWVYLSAIKSP